MLKNSPKCAVSTALSKSASAKIMFGDLPPSSKVVLFKLLFAALALMSCPTSVEPVNAILSTWGWSTKAAPVLPKPGTTLITPSGNPASLVNWARYKAVNGVCSAGFRIIQLPETTKFQKITQFEIFF